MFFAIFMAIWGRFSLPLPFFRARRNLPGVQLCFDNTLARTLGPTRLNTIREPNITNTSELHWSAHKSSARPDVVSQIITGDKNMDHDAASHLYGSDGSHGGYMIQDDPYI